MKLKNVISKLWVKHIRLRFADIYKCHNCNYIYKLKRQLECPLCGTLAYCDKDSELIIGNECDGGLATNGKCEICECYTDLHYPFRLYLEMTAYYIRQFYHHFRINKHECWIGHRHECIISHSKKKDILCINHYICIIPCLVFKFERWS